MNEQSTFHLQSQFKPNRAKQFADSGYTAHFLIAVEEIQMMLLMVSTVLASLAMGVTIAYALCSLLFLLFRTHVRAHRTVPLRIHAKTAQL